MPKPCNEWYIEPLSTFTNQVVSGILGGGVHNAGSFKAENGRVVNAWICNTSMRKRFESDEIDLGLRFRIWRKKRDGVLTRWRGHRPLKLEVLEKLAI